MTWPRSVADEIVNGGPVRLLVAWEQPAIISHRDAEAWANEQLAGLEADRAVSKLRLLRLARASSDCASSFDWLLEVCLPSRTDAARLISESPLQDFLCDLRSLRRRRMTLLIHERPWYSIDR